MAVLGNLLNSIGKGVGARPVPPVKPVTAKLPATPSEFTPSAGQPVHVSLQGPALEVRENPTGSVGKAYNAFLERQFAGNKMAWGVPKGQPSPAMASAAAPVQPTLEQMTEGAHVGAPAPAPAPAPAIDAAQQRIARLRPLAPVPAAPPAGSQP